MKQIIQFKKRETSIVNALYRWSNISQLFIPFIWTVRATAGITKITLQIY